MKLQYKSASFSRDKGGTSNLDPRALLRMTAREEELSGTLEQDFSDWFQKKIINKSVSDWSIQVRTRAGERAACLACERVVEVNTPGRFFIDQ